MISERQQRSIAQLIVQRIVRDLRSRKGLGNVWDEISDDTRDRIIDRWEEIARGELHAVTEHKSVLPKE